MPNYLITNDFVEIISGTSNTRSPLYLEAAKNLEDDNKSLGYLKAYMTSIEKIASMKGVNDSRISDTNGNITKLPGYDSIKYGIDFLSKNISGIHIIGDLQNIFKCLSDYQPKYIDGYERHIRLIELEYESAVYILYTGILFTISNYVDINFDGKKIDIKKKPGKDKGIITKLVQDVSKQLMDKNHKTYLNELIKGKDSIHIQEAVSEGITFVSNTIGLISSIGSGLKSITSGTKNLFKLIKNSMFGIIPLIRSILYLRYKKKADNILALDDQIRYIQLNIDQLNTMKNMDGEKKKEIIKKQEAYIERYRKKAEKLRAELVESEEEAAININKEDPDLNDIQTDEFILA